MSGEELERRAIEALHRLGILVDGRGRCQQCNHNEFLVVRHLIFPPVFDPQAVDEDDEPTIPCVGVICERCGHLRLFSAGYLGLLEEEDVDTSLN